LISRCDGTRTTRDLVNGLYDHFRSETLCSKEEFTLKVIQALDHLYRANIIVFGEMMLGWGWTGGERSKVGEISWGTANLSKGPLRLDNQANLQAPVST
jgi:hypothetical protein